MAASTRIDLKMDADEKGILARAAALMGTTMVGFVRTTAKEKALALLERDSRVTLAKRDFAAFTKALNAAFAPNRALKKALEETAAKVRRA